MKKSLKTQVGGTHYSVLAQQPIELIVRLNMNFIQGSILKYISRNKDNKLQDLEKALHYCQLGLDFPKYSNKSNKHCGDNHNAKNKIIKYVDQNNLSDIHISIIYYTWEFDYKKVETLIKILIEELTNEKSDNKN